jgi:hypothetical protein
VASAIPSGLALTVVVEPAEVVVAAAIIQRDLAAVHALVVDEVLPVLLTVRQPHALHALSALVLHPVLIDVSLSKNSSSETSVGRLCFDFFFLFNTTATALVTSKVRLLAHSTLIIIEVIVRKLL